jgi:hypothetical protein
MFYEFIYLFSITYLFYWIFLNYIRFKIFYLLIQHASLKAKITNKFDLPVWQKSTSIYPMVSMDEKKSGTKTVQSNID